MNETRTFVLDKLVADGIVESTEKQGGIVNYEVLEGQALLDALVNKLAEEIAEYKESRDPKELAQVHAVFRELVTRLGMTIDELDDLESRNQDKIGGFKMGHYVHTITLPANNKWAEYYAADPTRFPEIKS
jgi:predicted house-cleaning noncanonical NTP pyrophosphatase (MazG superfamily)